MLEKLLLERLHDIAEDGIAVGFGFSTTLEPKDHLCTYRPEWQQHYWDHGLVFNDPVIAFGARNLGAVRWDNVDLSSKSNAVVQARDFGMKNGFVLSVQVDGERAIAGLATTSRPSDAAINEARSILAALQAQRTSERQLTLTPRQKQILGLIADGMQAADVAHELQIDVNTVNFHKKQALKCNKGMVKNFTQLVAVASKMALI